MQSTFPDIRLLLIQAREEEDILLQEQMCFIERCNILPRQLHSINVIHEDLTDIDFSEFDAMMIGGSGAYSATEDYPWMPNLLFLVQQATTNSFPTFGSCWGHQIIARALGGTVKYDPERTEMGCHWIKLNTNGQSDYLFKDFPTRFKANMGHHDRVVSLPPEGVDLAFSDTQTHQAFRIRDKPIYGTQFHSELNAERERERLFVYRAHYTEVETEDMFQDILDSLVDTSEVDGLLERFIHLFVVKELRPR